MSLNFEDRHAAYCAGLSDGEAHRVDQAIEDEVQARLHALACEMLDMARRSARHGPAFSRMVAESGEHE